MAVSSRHQIFAAHAASTSLYDKINRQWHKTALRIFLLIVLAHWSEHLAQATQIYILDWPVPESRGVLGQWFPWLVKSELLHYGYALVMLAGLWVLRRGFQGSSYKWWMASFAIQFWHHIEHGILQWQAITGENLFGSPVPVSLIQLWVARVELHLFYNTIVFIPMVIGMYYHVMPPGDDGARGGCGCAWRRGEVGACSV